jgi:beta-lactamase regulating signal transducer with metallopeptidase domain
MTQLLDVAVRSSAILLIGLAVMPLLRRQSAAFRHWVLSTAVIGAIAVPVAALLLPQFAAPLAVSSVVAPRLPDLGVSSSPGVATATPAGGVATPEPVVRSFLGATLLLPLWASGALLSLTALLAGLLRLTHLERSAAPVTSGVWADSLAALRSGTPISPDPSIRVASRPGLLLVWGMRRPTILVPPAALSWPRERVDAVLRHELAHVRRQDWVLQMVAEAARALYWFNPLIWIACARLRTECEVACDDVVIESGVRGPEYADHVVAIAGELTTRHWLPAPAIVRASTLERRIRAMLDKTRNRRPPSRTSRGAAFAGLAAATLAVAVVSAQSFVSLRGTISDPSNAVLPGVKLLLVNEQTQAKYEIQTDRSGRYEFVGLPPGEYAMQAALPGFARFSGRVTVNAYDLQQDFTMTLGMLQETITIRSHPSNDARVVVVNPEVQRKIEARRQQATRNCPSITTNDGAPIGGNIRVPVKLRDVKPIYPGALTDTSGNVVLMGRLNTEGLVDEINVVSSTHPDFSDSLITAVRQWQFDATVLNCNPVTVPIQITANYVAQ